MTRGLSWQLCWRFLVLTRLVSVSHETQNRQLCGVRKDPVEQGREQHYTCHGNGEVVACFSARGGGTAGRTPSRSESAIDDTSVIGISSKHVFSASQSTAKNLTSGTTWWICNDKPFSSLALMNGRQGATWVHCKGDIAVGGETVIPIRSCAFLSENGSLVNSDGKQGTDQPSSLKPGSSTLGVNRRTRQELAALELESQRALWGESAQQQSTDQEDDASTTRSFVQYQDRNCTTAWDEWPEIHRRGLASNTVLVWEICPAVGNLFHTLGAILPVVRWLELGLVIQWKHLPGFRAAFDPGEIVWDQDAVMMREVVQQNGGHVFDFEDGFMTLSNSQVNLLASKLSILESNTLDTALAVRRVVPEKLRYFVGLKAVRDATTGGRSGIDLEPDTCAWNLLLKRSHSMVAALEANHPWRLDSVGARRRYVAWHIRTTEGESARSYNPEHHKYLFSGPSPHVCGAFLSATEKAEDMCQLSSANHEAHQGLSPVYISSNSKSMARNCSQDAAEHNRLAGFVDLGVDPEDAHTKFSRNPNTVINAFIDYLFLMDATVIVRTRSSFSGTVARIKGLDCHSTINPHLMVKEILVCQPRC